MNKSLSTKVRKEIQSRSIGSISVSMSHWRSLGVLFIFGILSVAMTWPLVTQLGTHIPGEGQDHLVHLWTYWWLKKALIYGNNPFYTMFLYYPDGVSLTTHNIAWLNFAFWLPMQALIGDIAAASLMYPVIFTLNGFAMYLLVYEWTRSTSVAFIGGLIFSFWPYIINQGGHVNMILLFWLPLTLLYLRRTLDGKRYVDAILCGVFLSLGGIARWQLLIVSSFIIVLYILYRLVTDPSCRVKKTIKLLIVVVFAAFIIMAPFAVPVALDQINRTNTEDLLLGDPAESQTDLLSYVIPNPGLTFWGKITSLIPGNLQVEKNNTPFLGFSVMALAIYGSIRKWRNARFWFLVSLLYIFLALGSELKIGGEYFPAIPMPYRLIDDIFLIQIVRKVHRFNAVLGLPIAMLASLGASVLLEKPRVAKWSPAVIIALSTIILMEFASVPYASRYVTTPEWYKTLSQEPGKFGVLDLPLDSRDHDKIYMLYQRTHGKPLVEGHVSRLPNEAFEFLESTPFLMGLLPDSVMDPLLFDVSNQLRALADANVKYLILHNNRVNDEDVTAWRNWLVFDPYYEDDELLVYRTDPQFGRDFKILSKLTEDIGIINARYWPDRLNPGEFLQVDASWGAMSQPKIDYDVCVQLVDPLGKSVQSQCNILAPSWQSSRWLANEVVRDHYIMHVDPKQPEGTYFLQLELFEHSSGASVGESAKIGELAIDELPEELSEPDNSLDAHWGDIFSILGYELATSPEKITINFYWQSKQSTDVSYKIFVHLIDDFTGTLVTQADYIPRNWTYPTSLWKPGEIIRDKIDLPLENLPPGSYHLQFGMYNPDTNQRLEVFTSEGLRYDEDSVYLETVTKE